MGSDPVKAGLVASFNRPGGNATGFTLWTDEMESKRLGLLREIVPAAQLIGILVNPKFPPSVQELGDLDLAAKGVGQRLYVASANNDAELETALTSLGQQRVAAVLVTAAPFFDTRLERIVSFTAQNRLPAIYQFREYAVSRRADQLRPQYCRKAIEALGTMPVAFSKVKNPQTCRCYSQPSSIS